MKRSIIFLAIVCFFIGTLSAQDKDSLATYILLKNATIIDCISDRPQKGDLLIKNQKIEQIFFEKTITPPEGTITYDLTGKFIMPGLIDAHVHMGTDPSGSDNLEITQSRLKYLLKNGITAVRDMAGDTRYLGYLARMATLNEIPSPDIYYSALMAGQTFFDDPRTHASAQGATPGDCPWMKAVDLSTDMSLAVAVAKGTNATGIKVYADLPADVIERIVTEAHAQNLKVWSHAAVFPAKPQAIVEVDVDVVSHATLLAWEGVDYLPSSAKGRYVKQENFDLDSPIFKKLVRTMHAKGTILDATLATYQHSRFDSTIFKQGIDLTKLAYQSGVKIGVGTDMGINESAKIIPLLKEMNLLVQQVGMTNMEVLKAATIINAEMIGKEKLIGTLSLGKQADILVLDKNPLMDIHYLSSVKYVFKKGERIDR